MYEPGRLHVTYADRTTVEIYCQTTAEAIDTMGNATAQLADVAPGGTWTYTVGRCDCDGPPPSSQHCGFCGEPLKASWLVPGRWVGRITGDFDCWAAPGVEHILSPW